MIEAMQRLRIVIEILRCDVLPGHIQGENETEFHSWNNDAASVDVNLNTTGREGRTARKLVGRKKERREYSEALGPVKKYPYGRTNKDKVSSQPKYQNALFNHYGVKC